MDTEVYFNTGEQASKSILTDYIQGEVRYQVMNRVRSDKAGAMRPRGDQPEVGRRNGCLKCHGLRPRKGISCSLRKL